MRRLRPCLVGLLLAAACLTVGSRAGLAQTRPDPQPTAASDAGPFASPDDVSVDGASDASSADASTAQPSDASGGNAGADSAPAPSDTGSQASPDSSSSSDAGNTQDTATSAEPSDSSSSPDSAAAADSSVADASAAPGSDQGVVSDPGVSDLGASSPNTDVGASVTSSPTVLAPGPFGAVLTSPLPQVTPPSGTGGQASTGRPTAAPTAPGAAAGRTTTGQETGPDRLALPAQARRTTPGPRLFIWSVDDILQFLAALFARIALAIAAVLLALLNALLGGPQGVVFQTPPAYSFQLGPVQLAWNTMRLIAEAGLALVVLGAGYGLLLGAHAGLPHLPPGQVVPRVMLGFVLIHFSLDWSSWLLQVTNGLSHTLLGEVPTDWGLHPNANDLGSAVAWVIELVMLLLLALGMWLRIALLDVLLVVAPLMLLLWTHPLTSDWGEWWFGLFGATALVQFFQDVALWLASQQLTAGGQNAEQAISHRVLAFALLLLTFRLPQLLPAPSASGGTASFLGLSRGFAAIARLPLVGGALRPGRRGGGQQQDGAGRGGDRPRGQRGQGRRD
jgi:hypothetical protein